MSRFLIYIGGLLFLFFLCCGCCSYRENFVGLTKKEVAAKLGKGPKMKNGEFRILYTVSSESPNQLAHNFFKTKEALLNDPWAIKAHRWQVFFHLGFDYQWHSYLLDFNDNIVVKQSERTMPHWTLAE